MSTSTNDITELRGHLFDVLRGLKDKSNPMEIERAHAVADVAQTVINSAKVEVDFIKATGNPGNSNFIPLAPARTPVIPAKPAAQAPAEVEPSGAHLVEERAGVRVTRHRLA